MVNVNLNAYHHGEVETGIGENLGAFDLLNLKSTYQWDERLTFSLNAQNVLDEQYRTYTTSAALQESGLPGRGRSIFFEVGYKLN